MHLDEAGKAGGVAAHFVQEVVAVAQDLGVVQVQGRVLARQLMILKIGFLPLRAN